MAPHPPRSTTAGQRRALVRPRLIRVLDGRWEHRVTLLVAGPGFGKSILLSQLTGSSSEGVDVVVACGPDDNRAWVLTTKVLAALGEDAPWFRRPTRPPRSTRRASPSPRRFCPAPPPRSPSPSTTSTTSTRRPRPLPCCADSSTTSPTTATSCCHHAPRPSCPSPRLRSHQEVLQLGERDLAFDDDELRRLAEARQQPDRDLEATGGWPALAELALLGDSTPVEGRFRDFLLEEVANSLDESDRELLVIMGAVGPIDDALASRLCRRPVDLATSVGTLPLVDSDGSVFEAHALWDAAVGSLVSGEQRAAWQREAIEVLQQRGEVGRAFQLAIGSPIHRPRSK